MGQPERRDLADESSRLGGARRTSRWLGAGPAGMAAVGHGAEVVAVEALDQVGGNAVWSTGYPAFVSSPMHKDLGIVDDEETSVRVACRMVDLAGADVGVIWDEQLVRLFAQESADTYRDLVGRVRFSRLIPRPRQHSVDRMAAVEDSWMFERAFLTDFARPDVTTLLATTAQRLLTDGAGRATEVVVRGVGGAREHIEARQGVVLATGLPVEPPVAQRYQPEFPDNRAVPGDRLLLRRRTPDESGRGRRPGQHGLRATADHGVVRARERDRREHRRAAVPRRGRSVRGACGTCSPRTAGAGGRCSTRWSRPRRPI